MKVRVYGSVLRMGFQSTLPVKGATKGCKRRVLCRMFQSTLPVKGATPSPPSTGFMFSFQSTLPVKGATRGRGFFCCCLRVSIHAPSEGSDPMSAAQALISSCFNPRSQ